MSVLYYDVQMDPQTARNIENLKSMLSLWRYDWLSLSVHEFCNLIGHFVWEIIPYLLGQTDQTGNMSPYSLFDVCCRCCFDVLYYFFIVVRMGSGDFNHWIWVRIARSETMERRSFARTLLWRNNHIHDTLLHWRINCLQCIEKSSNQLNDWKKWIRGVRDLNTIPALQRWNIRDRRVTGKLPVAQNVDISRIPWTSRV